MQSGKEDRKKKPIGLRILSKLTSFGLAVFLTVGVVFVVGLAVGFTVVYSFSDSELDATFANLDLDYTSVIYAESLESAAPVEYEILYNNENRVWISIDEMPQYLLDGLVATEDKRFYSHYGFDPVRTVYSTMLYAKNKLLGQSTANLPGGSTLTQQLIKTVTGTGQDRSPSRKFKEILQALYIERKYDKRQILEYYLNSVHFGNNCDGIYAAAKYYFNKDVKDLTPTECAAIICITQNPVHREPYANPETNKEKRIDVLYYMCEQGKLTQEEMDYWSAQELVLRDRTADNSTVAESSVMSWYTDVVFEEVKDRLMADFGYDEKQAVNYIYTGGLKIYTPMVIEYQDIINKYFANEENYIDAGSETKIEVAFELIDPATGNVLGLCGGRGEKTQNRLLSRVRTLRQPGSAIKPLTVYGYAIENNLITYGAAIDDVPTQITKEDGEDEWVPWPRNYDQTYSGVIDIYTALSHSLNTPSARLLDQIGRETSYNFAKTMLGLENLVEDDKKYASPLSVGGLSKGLTLEEMTAAYTPFANGGMYCPARYVSRVETQDGKILFENEVEKQVVFTPQTSYIVTKILSNMYAASGVSLGGDIAVVGKSGTTTDYYDRWFVGYSPKFLAGIWWGYDTPATNENRHHFTLWSEVMKQIHDRAGITSDSFEAPADVVECSYCSVSGQLPGPYCSMDPLGSTVRTGVFKKGTEPTETCSTHHQLYVCADSGQIAHENCPNAYLAVFRDVERSFPNTYVRVKDAEYVCPRLDENSILFNDGEYPVYTYMLPEGEYPSLPTYNKSRYRNCLCSAHTPSAIPHYYTYKFSGSISDEPGTVLPKLY